MESESAPAAAAEAGHGFPRSVTVRFVMQQPELAVQLFAGAATLLLGARFMKTLTTALVVARAVRAAAGPAGPRSPQREMALH